MKYDSDNQRVDNDRQPMRYRQIFPGFPKETDQGQRNPGTPLRPCQRQVSPQRPGQPQPPGFGPGQQQPQPPGFRPGQQPQPPSFGPGQGRPGAQPPSAPPDFTPQLPREEQQLLSGPSDFRGPFGGRIIDFRRQPRDFRRCLNRFTYIWLINGNNFWFYPVFIGRNAIEGFRWRRNRWEYDRININRILFHLCF